MKSNWEKQKQKSSYHFDQFKVDPAYDTMRYVGRYNGEWSEDLNQTISSSKEVTWRTRNPADGVSKDIDLEEYDLESVGADPNMALTNLEYNLREPFQAMTDALHLTGKIQSRVHVQQPGQVWNIHIDKLEKFNEEDTDNVMRFMVMLNDYEPGHFLQYGNYIHQFWRAGEIYTFDWMNVPHCTANAGMKPRCTLLITGTATAETYRAIAKGDFSLDI